MSSQLFTVDNVISFVTMCHRHWRCPLNVIHYLSSLYTYAFFLLWSQ